MTLEGSPKLSDQIGNHRHLVEGGYHDGEVSAWRGLVGVLAHGQTRFRIRAGRIFS
jgi:hypothetical protein